MHHDAGRDAGRRHPLDRPGRRGRPHLSPATTGAEEAPDPDIAPEQELDRAVPEAGHRGSIATVAALAIAGFALTILRRPSALTEASLWAEDATVFLSQASTRGWRVVNDSYNGYLHTVPRGIAWVASGLPFRWTPVVYALGSMAVTVACCALVLSRRVAWLLPRFHQRVAAFVLLLLLPRVAELHATLTNTIWWCGIALLLLILSDDPASRTGRAAELVGVAVLVLSGANGILLAPFVAFRWWRTRSWTSVAVAGVWWASAAGQLWILSNSTRPDGGDLPPVVDLGRWAIERLVGSVFISGRYVGDQAQLVEDWPLWVTAVVVLAGASVAVVLVTGLRPSTWLLLGGVVAAGVASGYVTIGASARLLPERYTAIPLAALLIGLVAARPRVRPIRWLQVGLWIWLGVARVFDVSVPEREPVPWDPVADCVEAGRSDCVARANPVPGQWATPVDAG